MGNASKALKLVFRNGCFTRHTEAMQVERATFDHLLLQHARAFQERKSAKVGL